MTITNGFMKFLKSKKHIPSKINFVMNNLLDNKFILIKKYIDFYLFSKFAIKKANYKNKITNFLI